MRNYFFNANNTINDKYFWFLSLRVDIFEIVYITNNHINLRRKQTRNKEYLKIIFIIIPYSMEWNNLL